MRSALPSSAIAGFLWNETAAAFFHGWLQRTRVCFSASLTMIDVGWMAFRHSSHTFWRNYLPTCEISNSCRLHFRASNLDYVLDSTKLNIRPIKIDALKHTFNRLVCFNTWSSWISLVESFAETPRPRRQYNGAIWYTLVVTNPDEKANPNTPIATRISFFGMLDVGMQ